MSNNLVNIATRSHNYDPPPKNKDDNDLTDKSMTSIPPPTKKIHIEKHVLDTVFHPLKSLI